MAKLNPYLSFENCREAMIFYKDCLGGELVMQTVGESPAMAAQMPPEMKDHILHATLTTGDMVIMASDLSKGKRMEGNTVQLCINCDSETQIDDYFAKLSAGGSINDPLMDMPWGGRYGAVTDKFGKRWVFNYQKSE